MKTEEYTLIKDGQELKGAKCGSYEIRTYDDGFGPLWISRNSIGINGIVRAKTWEDAYGICEDEFFDEATETIEELQKEYGFKRKHRKVVLGAHGERYAEYPEDYPDGQLLPKFVRWETVETPDPEGWVNNDLFQESFGFRPDGPNSSDKVNHGIYAKDLNGDYLDLLTPRLAEDLNLELIITDVEV